MRRPIVALALVALLGRAGCTTVMPDGLPARSAAPRPMTSAGAERVLHHHAVVVEPSSREALVTLKPPKAKPRVHRIRPARPQVAAQPVTRQLPPRSSARVPPHRPRRRVHSTPVPRRPRPCRGPGRRTTCGRCAGWRTARSTRPSPRCAAASSGAEEWRHPPGNAPLAPSLAGSGRSAVSSSTSGWGPPSARPPTGAEGLRGGQCHQVHVRSLPPVSAPHVRTLYPGPS